MPSIQKNPRKVLAIADSNVLFIVLMLFVSQSLYAQIKITFEKDLKPLSTTQEVHCLQAAGLNEITEVSENLTLAPGDEIYSISTSTVSVKLSCPQKSSMILSGQFRVVIMPPGGADCVVNLLGGVVDVDSNQPTGVVSGETRLGTKRTQYSVQVIARGRKIQRKWVVFDGEVEFVSPSLRENITAKQAILSTQHEQGFSKVVANDNDFSRAAQVYARMEVSRAVVHTPNLDVNKAFEQLKTNYFNVISNPVAVEARNQLAANLITYNLSETALYQLDRANEVPNVDSTQRATTALLKGTAYKQINKGEEAKREFKKAYELDRSVFLPDYIKKYDVQRRFGYLISGYVTPGNIGEIHTWSGWSEVPGGGTTDVAPAAAVFQGKIYLFARGIGDGGIYVNIGNAYDGQGWSGWTQVPGSGTTDASLTATPRQDRLYVFAKGINDRGIYVNVMDLSGNWSGWNLVPGGGTTDVALRAATFQDKIYLFSKGINDRQIYYKIYDGSNWSGWSLVGGTTDSPLSTAVAFDKLLLFSKGIEDRRIYVNSLSSSGWSGWTEVAGGRTTDTSVGAASIGTDVSLFAKGDDQKIYITVGGVPPGPANPNWKDWMEVPGGGTTNTAPAPVAGASNRLFLFAKGINDNHIYINIRN